MLHPILSFLCLFSSVVLADNGMDMSMDGPMALTGATMTPYLHFSAGDTLWFLGWVPQSKGAIGGACVGLFLLGLVDRWLAAIRSTANTYWRTRGQIAMANRLNSSNAARPANRSVLSRSVGTRYIPPFILSHDLSRGILHAAQMALNFAFMLVVMTYQVAFILSIVIGLGVGEMIFGRYIYAAHSH
ncbi:hypothetical protein CPC08DRAFT_234169 [Agrocybe pediades]|nr:hypothetical protein CPC08DRAFT_234169 [Agrocybe pediades]